MNRRYIVEIRLCSPKRVAQILKIFEEQLVYLQRKEAIEDDLIGLFVKNDDTGEELDRVITAGQKKNLGDSEQ